MQDGGTVPDYLSIADPTNGLIDFSTTYSKGLDVDNVRVVVTGTSIISSKTSNIDFTISRVCGENSADVTIPTLSAIERPANSD